MRGEKTMYDVFSLPDITFPGDFLWGSATSGHQIEGDNIHSQWWAKEQSGETEEKSGRACNHYELYKEDVDLIGALGHRGYRMSLEWSRIEPQEGTWDDVALAHYVDLLGRLCSTGIKPFITLHHFTHPLWFERLGGFSKKDNLRYFERFLRHSLPRIAQFAEGWNVFNEFNLGAGPGQGHFKFNMIRAHALGYHLIKRYSSAPVSTAHAFVHWFPYRRHDDLDNRMTGHVDFLTNEFFFHAIRTGELVYPHMDAEYESEVKNALDFWSVNYYTRHMVDSRKGDFEGERFIHKTLRMIKKPFFLEEIYPEGLISNLERLMDLPVYITENGCSCDDDRFRMVYLLLHLSALREAIDRGVDVKGYFHWSLLDNYEWGSFVPRFGLVQVDFRSFERTPKPSAFLYRDIIRGNGITRKMIRDHLKELPTLSS